MGATCCSNKEKEDHVDMDNAKKKNKKKSKKRMEKRSNKSAKGAEIEERDHSMQAVVPDYDETNPDTLFPKNPTLQDVMNNETDHSYISKSRSKGIEYWYEINREDWEFVNTKNNVDMYQKKTENPGILYVRGVMTVNRPIRDIADHFDSLENKLASKTKSDKLELVKDIGHNSRIEKYLMKGSITFESRDFVYCTTKYELKNGHWAIVDHSVDHADHPETSSATRGMIDSLTLLKPEGNSLTKVLSTSKIDLKGNLPTAVIKKILAKKLDEFIALKNGLE
jgi:hypothetical protein